MIYTKDLGQPHVEAICWVLDQFWKHFFFANLKKYWFHQNEVCFLEYVVSSKKINIKAKRTDVIKDWPESKSVHNNQVFLGFANFYWQFIQGFSRIAVPLISMLKTTRLFDKLAPSKNNGSKLNFRKNDNSRLIFKRNDGNNKVNGFGVNENGVKHAKKLEKLSKLGKLKSEKTSKSWKLSKSGKSKSEKTFKSQNWAKSRKKLLKSGNSTNFDAIKDGPKFLTPNTRITFNRLWLAFIEALIFWHFDLKCHI